MDHSGKIAIVTGAAQGIGKACAERLFSDGASVVISDIQNAQAEKVANALDPHGNRAVAIRCDVGKRDDVTRLAADTKRHFGSLDIMVNNAAISCATAALDLSEEVASIVSFLASEDASYVTGQTLNPDRGRAYLNYTVPVAETLPELELP